MQRIVVATLMAVFFGLFSMPASQAAPANGKAVDSSFKAVSPLDKVQWRGRRRCHWVHRWRSRRRWYCW
jgi:hypothetical protein